jgi:hypothetical protein
MLLEVFQPRMGAKRMMFVGSSVLVKNRRNSTQIRKPVREMIKL